MKTEQLFIFSEIIYLKTYTGPLTLPVWPHQIFHPVFKDDGFSTHAVCWHPPANLLLSNTSEQPAAVLLLFDLSSTQ